MNRWVRLPDDVLRWQLCGVHAGVAWLLGGLRGELDAPPAARLEARDLGSGRTLASFEVPAGSFAYGGMAVDVAWVNLRARGQIQAFTLDGPLWELSAELLAAGPEMVVVLDEEGLGVVDPATGERRIVPLEEEDLGFLQPLPR